MGLGGAVAGGLTGLLGGLFQNRWERDAARENRNWQERMSNTAVQRAVADYTAAGLNPALAYDKAASSGGGATAVVSNAVQSGLNNALQVKALQSNLALQQAQTGVAAQQMGVLAEDIQKRKAETAQTNASTDLLRAQIPEAQASADFWKTIDRGGPAMKGLGVMANLLKIIRGR